MFIRPVVHTQWGNNARPGKETTRGLESTNQVLTHGGAWCFFPQARLENFIFQVLESSEKPCLSSAVKLIHLLLGSKALTNLYSILKSRHYFADKDLSSQSYGFSSSHVWMWELDYLKRKLSTKELILLNCVVEEDSWESLGLQGDTTSPS